MLFSLKGALSMRLEQLYCFVEAAHCGSMAAAAHKLYISQQNVSKSIKQLEVELGQRLFTRSNQGIHLTPEGRRIYEIASEITNKATWLTQQYKPSIQMSEIKGILYIFAHVSMSSFLVPIIEQLHLLHPQVRIAVSMQNFTVPLQKSETDNPAVFLVSLLKDDLASLQPLGDIYDIYCFREEPLKIYMNTTSPFLNQQSLSLKTLSEQPLIDHAGDFQSPSFSAKIFSRYGYKPTIIFSCSNSQLTLEYIAHHNAYCLGTNDIISPHTSIRHTTICIKPLKENLQMLYLLIVPKASRRHSTTAAFLRIFEQQTLESCQLITF